MPRKAFDPTFKMVNADGTPSQYFNEVMQDIIRRLPTKPVSVTDPTAGQKLTYNATTGQYEPA